MMKFLLAITLIALANAVYIGPSNTSNYLETDNVLQERSRSQSFSSNGGVPRGAFRLSMQKRFKPDNGGVLPVDESQEKDGVLKWLMKKARIISSPITNQVYYYTATIFLGTPAKPVELLVDTGSADTWTYTPQSRFIAGKRGNSPPSSKWNPNESETFSPNGTRFMARYGIGQTYGQWCTDVITFGHDHIPDFTFGLADDSDSSSGILGLGRLESEVTAKDGVIYESLPYKLASSGAIKWPSYSIGLGGPYDNNAQLLFGAYDRAQYEGGLNFHEIVHPKHIGLQLDQLRLDGIVKNNQLKKPIVAVLDSGTTISYVPKDVYLNLHIALNANPSFAIGQKYYCDCNTTSNLVLNFDGREYYIPAYMFLTPIENYVSKITANVAFPPNSCYVGIEPQPKEMDFMLIGDNMLRALYMVVDLQNSRVGLGQASYSTQNAIELITGDTQQVFH